MVIRLWIGRGSHRVPAVPLKTEVRIRQNYQLFRQLTGYLAAQSSEFTFQKVIAYKQALGCVTHHTTSQGLRV